MTEFSTIPFALSALHDNDSIFQALIEHSADLITLLDQHGQILYQSPSARQHLGHDRDRAPRRQHISLDHLHPEDREWVARQVHLSRPGETLTLRPYRMRHANGSWRWWKGTAVNLLDVPEVRGILVQSRDVTAEIMAAQRARALEGLSMALASTSTTDEVVQVMLLQGIEAMGALAGGVLLLEEGGTLVTVLGSAGYPERLERPWRHFGLDTPVPAADAIREDRDMYLTREDWQILYPHLEHAPASRIGSNAVLLLKSNGKVMGAITLSFQEDRVPSETERQHLRSVAAQCALALERSELHARLQAQERLYRKLAEYSSDPVSIISLTGTTQYISPSVERMLGHTPQERIGLNVFEGIHPDDRDRVNRAFREIVGGRLPCLVTYRFQHKAGHWVWLESTGTNAVHDPDLQGVVINTRDVTARIEGEQARQASERRLQLIGEQSDTLIHIYNPDQECIYISPAAQNLLGYSPEELQACPGKIRQLVHPEDLPRVEAAWKIQAATPAYRIRGRDGTVLWVESTVRQVLDEQGVLVETHVATRDITSRKEAEQALRLQLRRFQQLVDLTAEFAAQEDTEQHIQTALERCLDLTPYTYSFYFPVNGDTLIEPLHAGENAEQMLAWAAPLERIHRNGEIGKALRRHEAFFAGAEQAVFSPPEPLPRQVWTSLAVLPVVSRGVLRGFMAFGTNGRFEVDGDTRRLLTGVSEHASRAVERSAHLDDLKLSREETLRALGLALEYRDYETKGHTDRVVALTEHLGQALGISGDDLDALRWGAFLHDTGKVAIPDAILLKPGKLDPEEWEVIKRHPGIGYEMLHHIPSLPPTALEVVLYHQERWNGSGYPKGLAGADIPLAARVFAVVDVYDALTSERPYKRAWTHEEAAAQLRKEAGELLDARVVETFLNTLNYNSSMEDPSHDAR
ncbi:PAS domain S-box protein [Deinococcus marmoris]|uniref:Response regulator n=1 Tax=Deinococcus marmoris TaxID=249408 RepID=A0A1U7NZB5_9DEIO|nr:PAS domain S-box protein [Deinococcus marmoris]OLV18258.1 response regulator [Deinococcus marmoris]